MTSKFLGRLMRGSVIAAALCGLLICMFIIPSWGQSMVQANPEPSDWFYPWLGLTWLFSLPCFAVLVYIWKVSGAVICETVFTVKTAGWVKMGAVLFVSDAVFLFAGNLTLLLLDRSDLGILLFSTLADVFIFALALLAAVLSRYLTRAAVLQEDSEGTL